MQFSILAGLGFASTALAAAACNGNSALCDRLYSNITTIGTHDSAFVGDLPTDNQAVSVSDQLNAGIRFLQAQTHNNDNELKLCHTSCIEEDSGLLVDYLTTIKTWLDSNTDQVVTLLLTNGDGVPISNFSAVMDTSGLSSYAYAPNSTLTMSQWPTLQQLIDGGHRLVMFMDSGANTAIVPYILDEWTYFFETPYDTTDPTFNECTLDRPSGASASGRMYIVNHFLDVSILGILIPDTSDDAQTNAATGNGSIGAQADLCYGIYGRMPNFVLVDNFDTGDVFTAQNNLNSL
ncbi:MAG: hypothetical protein M1818_002752 [Claussenomyces sp. TS43310]|nr:MAG: hypothetical protein M1818_002752 [Claussenomyces sp. TS43310]